MPTTEYDISRAFKRIENDLIDSMMRNMKRHQVEEAELGKEWEQWQAIQLAELEEYRKNNMKRFSGDFSDIQEKIDDIFYATYRDAQSAEEHRLMDRIKKGDFRPTEDKGGFFRLNEPKLEALIMATQADFARAEYALLRQANDRYRQVIFDAMTYANVTNDYKRATKMAVKDFAEDQVKRDAEMYASQGLTYAQAVDKATHDLLKGGLRPIAYKNGARHSLSDYASMALRTGNKRAYLMGEGNAHDRYGLHTVRVNRRTQACPKCVGFLGRLLIDDVYGGGTRAEATAKGIPTLSDAMQAGFLHPNCKDVYSAYIEGISQPAKPWTQEEIGEIVGEYNQEQALKHAEDMQASYERMAKYSLDPENQQTYQTRADNWQARIDEIKNTPAVPVTPTPVAPNVASQATSPAQVAPTINGGDKAVRRQLLNSDIEQINKRIASKQDELDKAKQALAERESLFKWYERSRAEADQKGVAITEVIEQYKERAQLLMEIDESLGKGTIDRYNKILDNLDSFESGAYIKDQEKEIKRIQKEARAIKAELKEKQQELEDLLGTPKLVESAISQRAQLRGIKKQAVKYSPMDLTEEEIIKTISGGDKTSGSCASVAFTYTGRKVGYDVYDFRGGKSREFFAKRSMKIEMINDWGVDGFIEYATDDVQAVHTLMAKATTGKEYMVCTGCHSAILKKDASGTLWYLELQHPTASENGWHELTDDKLVKRFACKKFRYDKAPNVLLDVESMGNNDKFADMLQYINTTEKAQKKGVSGNVR